MRSLEIIEALLKKHNTTKATLAKRIGVTPQALTSRFKGNSGKASSLVEATNALNYKVVVMPAEVKIKSDWYEVTVEE